ncbi:MAG TPA: 2-succinyl-5-enolpyruvyl-6-hydroxy-3-cyclohexene-1-carboxylic-acid synthase [Candidatus Omnitrophica bacterium]|nr:2-succinyl-5-enolpyruvyl-6-hydroxy-3-cyclohexene-1-carboxylic-acid synthase [Candidatus Omnitrophota bacterium]HBG64713.1 2-succinyl-5-enolpyruvyl-6-hydroxy-3-cyclohexene-1-carboxylic-acid synthase [Candidatus Omnitrophota bacterium]HCD37646.1 2-succinyl-5-enolpyruvyl-6-hydroxy-3-cyclohexene-1-carboxylic-acid synthase [Candidatus Omnitrophota bacterium]
MRNGRKLKRKSAFSSESFHRKGKYMVSFSKAKNINHLWGRLIIEELTRCGVEYFCIAPGSRSGPLVVAVAENKRAKSCIHFDERGLAYYALGYVASSGKTACLIATSGTAVANFYPAIIEASKKKLPLIILTADRPPELRNTGANQTIDQVKIFGDYARFFFDMPCPSKEMPLEAVLTTIDQAVYRARANYPGPVHINCMFREPLTPIKEKGFTPGNVKSLSHWLKNSLPFTRYKPYEKRLSLKELKNVAQELSAMKRGIIAVGKLKSGEEKSVLALARTLQWPVFADITSGLRLKSKDASIIHYFDQLLLEPALVTRYRPDGVLHLGGRLTSSRWYEFIKKITPLPYITVLNHPLRNDPLHCLTTRVECSVSYFCGAIKQFLKQRKRNDFTARLQKASERVSQRLFARVKETTALTPDALAQAISQIPFQETGLFLANSMPIRIMDMFAGVNKNLCCVGANRGASGIDGNLASAIGFADGLAKPVVALLGDLAFLHDLNSLALLKELKTPFVIIVINDRGGGIFSFLPISGFPNVFEKYFAAAHTFSFEMAAKMFQIGYVKVKVVKEFTDAYRQALGKNGATIIEIEANREENYKAICSLQNTIRICLKR